MGFFPIYSPASFNLEAVLKETFSRLTDLIAREHKIDGSSLQPSSGLADAGLDSLAVAELIFSIQDEFNVDLGDLDPSEMPATMSELTRLIDERLALV